MLGPRILARTMSVPTAGAGKPFRFGNLWQYHSRSDRHSKVACWGLVLDLLGDCPLLRDLPADACFYFAHSYAVHCDERSAVAATTSYGQEFVSVLHSENIFGTQFHPEKSQANGLRVLRNFVAYC